MSTERPALPPAPEAPPFTTTLADDTLIVTVYAVSKLPAGTRISIELVLGPGVADPVLRPAPPETPTVARRAYLGGGAPS